jgi:glycosyltransferase involved in cell wall biosynthesis
VARSVGLYLLYDKFDREAGRRWPGRRGKLLAGPFYDAVARWFRRLSDAAVRHADLLNLPNEEEKSFLQNAQAREWQITVQPYGLSEQRRQSLARAAALAESRLERRKICFLGMWSVRKGARDWPEILRLVWKQIPEARFSFLGTMVESETVWHDLGLKFSERIETVSHYSQDELPGLLAECAVGAFPSYVEGFGIAVLEQLAAGIPTVAFDVAGPRDMLGPVSSALLVPAGDLEAFADFLVRILQLDLADYRDLSNRCAEQAAHFDWRDIARKTASVYQEHLAARPVADRRHGN